MPSRHNKLILLLVLLLSCSSRDLALAFVQRGGVPCTAVPLSTGGVDPTIHRSPAISMPSLRVRGGGANAASSTKLGNSNGNGNTSNHHNGDKEKTGKLANTALQSIRYCARMCFLAVLSDFVVTFVDDGLWSKFFGAGTLSWADYADIFDSLSLLVFGGGLWYISALYFRSMSDTSRRMSHDGLYELFRTMRWIWGTIAANLALVSVTMAASLPAHVVDGPLYFLVDRVSARQLSLSTAGVLAVGTALILGDCRRTADKEVKAYRERNNIVKLEDQIKTRRSDQQKFDRVRAAAYGAFRNQALCAGSFGVLGSLELVKWVASLNADTAVVHVFAASDFFTTFAVTALVIRLSRALLRAAIAEIIGDPDRVMEDNELYNDLFVAQTEFYSKAAETMKLAAIFRLLPYILTPTVPFMLRVLERIVKATGKISPSFSTKAMELIGGQM